ncbi:MAG: DUF3467 domain-containing protein [Anaerolineae bacterium]|nr:DUF3467 domain-containing protein [Anaerolineae bacterium]
MSDPDSRPDEIKFKLVWPESLAEYPTIYANHLFITHTGSEFYLVFGEAVPFTPANLSPEKLETLKSVSIKVVAKIAVSPPAMLAMASVIQANVEKFKTRFTISEEEE